MSDMYIDVDIAVAIIVNKIALTDDTDFKTREVAIAYDEAGMDLVWNFTTSAGVVTQTAVTPTTAGDYDWTHVGDAIYKIEITASGGASINNDTEGSGFFSGICDGVLAWSGPIYTFRAAGLNNALIDDPYSTTRGLSGTALPAVAADGAGGLPISDAGGLDLDNEANTAFFTTPGTLVDLVWDEPLTGATHNVATSSGKRLRQTAGIIMDDGTAQAGGANTITLAAGASATDDLYWQSYIAIVVGTGVGQGHHIISYDGTTKVAIMDDDWVVQPDATSEYIIYGSGSHDEYMSGLARAGDASTITLEATATAGDDLIKNDFISIVSGTGGHQSRRVTAYNGTTKVATVSPNWEVNPDATSGYWILPQGRTSVAEVNDKLGYSLAATGLDLILSTATGAVQIAKAIWDRVISKALHDISQSAGKVVREGFADTFATGTAQAGGVNTITLEAGASALDDVYIEQYIMIVDGTGVDQGHHILSYNGTTKVAVVDDNWITQPDATSEYVIKGSSAHVWADAGVAGGGGATTITLNGSAVATDDYYNNMLIYLHSGTGFGQARRITDYDGTTKIATVGTAWTTNPNNTTGYSVESRIAVNNEDVADIQTRIPVALIGGRIDSNIGAISESTDAADKLEASAETIEIAAAAAGTLSTTEMTTNLTEATPDHYNGRIIIWTSGVLLRQATDITDYDGATKKLTFTAVTEAPTASDTFVIV